MRRALILMLLLCAIVTHAEPLAEGKITLLALLDAPSGRNGTIATLNLELLPGEGRVFLRAFPMTKITTQASLRFAQQVACRELDVDCSQYDFLFSIDALPGIVGGPSAGSSATVLTSALLMGKNVPSHVAMTGTVNSGGVFGSVGGVKEKIEAASRNSARLVFIPPGTRHFNESNTTLDLVEYGRELGIEVKDTPTLPEVLELLFNRSIDAGRELVIDERYAQIMNAVGVDLCDRTRVLKKDVDINSSAVLNYSTTAEKLLNEGAAYSAASFCFRANVAYRQEWYTDKNLSSELLDQRIAELKNDAKEVKSDFEAREITTLTDLQTYMAVMERVDEAIEMLDETKEKSGNSSAALTMGYAEERLFSAKAWSRFFNGRDKKVTINKALLQNACTSKVAEAEERYNYVRSVLPDSLGQTKDDIDQAYRLSARGNNIMCLYMASKAKAQANVILSLMGVSEENFDNIISLKLNVTKRALVQAQDEGIFPIIAYSYYEYANSLADSDRITALLFTEYALELSNLDIYFEQRGVNDRPKMKTPATDSNLIMLILGFLLGAIIMFVLLSPKGLNKNKQSVRRRGKKYGSKERR